MFKSYFKIAIRNLRRNPLISFINIFGLGLSLSVVMMEMIIVQHELSYDKFHPFPDRTYRIISEYTQKDGRHFKLASTPIPLQGALKGDQDLVEGVVSVYPSNGGIVKVNGKEFGLSSAFTQPSFFNVFGFSLAYGDPATALEKPNSVVLRKDVAEKFFGKTDAVGQVISIEKFGEFVVSGVLNEAPGRSHIDFEGYCSFSSLPLLTKNHVLPERSAEWGDFMRAYTYVVLKKGVRESALQNQLNSLIAGYNKQDKNGAAQFSLQSIKKVTPGSDAIQNDIGRGTTWGKLLVGINICLILLIAACFNHTNLAVARALTRAKEGGVRKIVGARRYQLILQHLFESTLLSFLSLAFACWILYFIVRYAPFNDGYEFIPSAWHLNFSYIAGTVGLGVFTGLLAGLVPAFIISAFKPLRVLKGLSTAKVFGKIGLQKTLIVFQYSLSLTIIIFLVTFVRQFGYIGSMDPGFEKNNIAVVETGANDPSILASKLGAVQGVQSVAALSSAFHFHFSGTSSQAWLDNHADETVRLNYFFSDNVFIPMLKMQLLAGRNFSARAGGKEESEIIINLRAAQRLGFKSPQEAVGQKLWVNDSLSLSIVGVLKDFRYQNAGIPDEPVAFRDHAEMVRYLFVRGSFTDRTAAFDRINQVVNAGRTIPLSVSWLDKDIEKANSQTATISLLGYLAFIAISIATLGLLGLVIFSVETRKKEIGIRKVIGAGKRQIIQILSMRFIWLILLSGFIAVPLGYTMGVLFLQNFVDRVGGGLLSALVCFAGLLIAGLATVLSQTYRASAENPVVNLKND